MNALVPTCPLENPSKPSLTANILCPSEMPTLTAERTAAFMPAAGAPTFNTATLKLLWGHKKNEHKMWLWLSNHHWKYRENVAVVDEALWSKSIYGFWSAIGSMLGRQWSLSQMQWEAEPWGELRSMESTLLILHFTDLQCELPQMEPQFLLAGLTSHASAGEPGVI